MYQGHKLFVIVPAYNEAEKIAETLKGVPLYVDGIVVVDDASRDETWKEAARVEDPRITMIRHDTNRGVGGSMKSGYAQALASGAEILVKIDGDGQMDTAFLPNLIDPLIHDGFGYTKGNRFLHDDALTQMPRHRLVGNFLLTFLTKQASGYWNLFDPQNGYTAIRAEALKHLDLNRISDGFFFENDMLVNLNIHGVRARDIPIPARYRNEVSSLRVASISLTFPFYLFHRFWYRLYQKYVLRNFSPIGVFYYSGTALLLFGTFKGAAAWATSILYNRLTPTGTVMLAVLPFLVGFQLVLQAIMLEIQESSK
jgi:glycosyltransferase involved in cell wall biosynthesis